MHQLHNNNYLKKIIELSKSSKIDEKDEKDRDILLSIFKPYTFTAILFYKSMEL